MNARDGLLHRSDALGLDPRSAPRSDCATIPRLLGQDASPPQMIALPSRRSALWVLLTLSWIVPLSVLTIAAWWTWRVDLMESEERIRTTLTIIEERVRKVFDT